MEEAPKAFAILNQERQVLAVNKSLLKAINAESVSEIIGLRPGEALQCHYSGEEPGGCGTSRYCPTCGAAVAMVTSLKEDRPVERICSIRLSGDDNDYRDLVLSVRCSPVVFESERFLLLFLLDISKQQAMAALERTFFHDVKNTLTPLIGATEMLGLGLQNNKALDTLKKMVPRLAKEIEMQRVLSYAIQDDYERPESAHR